jgi:hypothetical protein
MPPSDEEKAAHLELLKDSEASLVESARLNKLAIAAIAHSRKVLRGLLPAVLDEPTK